MKPFCLSLTLCGALLATGCVSTSPQAMRDIAPRAGEADAATLVVYREKSAQAALADVYIGTDDGYFIRLGDDEYAEVDLRSGFYELKAKAKGSVPSEATVKLNPEETVCMRARPNHEELHLLVIPFVNALVPSFVLEETECVDLDRFERQVAVAPQE